jgi:uncharacterized membrane protein
MTAHVQLFFHILGAVGLFGAVSAIAVMALAARRVSDAAPLASGSLSATIFVAAPSWAATFVFGYWAKSKEGWPDSLTWLKLAIDVANVGVIVVLALAGLSYAWLRRPASSRLPLLLGIVSVAYVLALGVAWWAMTAKVPS